MLKTYIEMQRIKRADHNINNACILKQNKAQRIKKKKKKKVKKSNEIKLTNEYKKKPHQAPIPKLLLMKWWRASNSKCRPIPISVCVCVFDYGARANVGKIEAGLSNQ